MYRAQRLRFYTLLFSFATILLAWWLPKAAVAISYRAVALTGQHVPGAPAGIIFTSFAEPVINNLGQTAFQATLGGPGVDSTNNTGIWSERSGTVGLVARTGSPAPGTESTVTYSSFGLPIINDVGQTAFMASIFGAGINSGNNAGIWSEGHGNLSLVARSGSPAPGSDTAYFGPFVDYPAVPLFNNLGQTAFLAGLTGANVGSSNNYGIFAERDGDLTLVTRKGSPAPGMPAGVTFTTAGSTYGFTYSSLNDAGQSAFGALLVGPGINSSNNFGIWSDRSGSVQRIVSSGDPAPGMPSGVVFASFSGPPGTNNNGQSAFYAGTIRPGSSYSSGIWSENGGLHAIAVESDPAPGAGAGVYFRSLVPGDIIISRSGATAFDAELRDASGQDSNSLWVERGGNLQLLERSGTQAPGAPPGEIFSSEPFARVLNSGGRIAFYAGLSGTSKAGIWAEGNGGLELVAIGGRQFEIAPGDIRTISSVHPIYYAYSGNEDGHRSFFNDLGQVVFAANFTDGSSGVFVANVGVPEPENLVLLMIGAITLGQSTLRKTRGRNDVSNSF